MMRTLLLVLLSLVLLALVLFWLRRILRRRRRVEPAPHTDLTRHAPPVTEALPRWPEDDAGKALRQPPSAPISRVDLTPNQRAGGQLLSERQLEFMARRTAILELHDTREVRRGMVGRAPDGSEVKLLDTKVCRPSSIRSFEEFTRRRDELQERIRSVDPRITTCWPTRLIADTEGAIDAYYRVPLEKKFELAGTGGTTPRNLNLAVDLRGGPGQEISPAQARELLTLTCKWLHVMHDCGMVHGEVAFHNIAYSADTETSICVLDFEASRRVGMSSFRGPNRSETHWLDPQADAEEASQDSDRYQLALLAFRLLVTRTRNGLVDADAVPQVLDGFTEHETSLLRGLWERASGPRGTRPTTHEWIHAVGASGSSRLQIAAAARRPFSTRDA
jgi:hypothetical protein